MFLRDFGCVISFGHDEPPNVLHARQIIEVAYRYLYKKPPSASELDEISLNFYEECISQLEGEVVARLTHDYLINWLVDFSNFSVQAI